MEKNQTSNNLGLGVFGTIFFIFGFATTFIITMTAPVKAIFGLSEFEAQLLSSAFFITYPIMSIPTGQLINKIGYKWTVILGLLLMGIGSLTFVPAAQGQIQSLFYVATFILATGVVFLQVAANPYVTALGPESSASSRLNLTQALNSIATMVAPWLIGIAIFKGLDLPAMATEAQEKAYGLQVADRIPVPFIMMASVVIVVAVVLFTIKLPSLAASKKEGESKSIWKYPHVLLGAFGIFAYVGAEVGNAGLIVPYFRNTSTTISAETASTYAAIYWGGAMVGRFFGSLMFSDMKKQHQKIHLCVGNSGIGICFRCVCHGMELENWRNLCSDCIGQLFVYADWNGKSSPNPGDFCTRCRRARLGNYIYNRRGGTMDCHLDWIVQFHYVPQYFLTSSERAR
jgi:FHS family L-fucose permease-like MFS transporter